MKNLAAFILSLSISTVVLAGNEPIRFVTLDWPPYLGEKLPDQGFVIKILKQAYAVEGYTNLDIKFLPWSRALNDLENKKAVGCLLAYYSKAREEKFIYSDPISNGPIHFAYLKSNPFQWKTLSDLKNKRIGVVKDYVNAPDLDDMIEQKKILTEVASSDLMNLQKLSLGRSDVAVIDRNVFKYLIHESPELSHYKDQLMLHPASIDDKKLYILFSKTPKGRKMAEVFNRGLKKIKGDLIAKKYLDSFK